MLQFQKDNLYKLGTALSTWTWSPDVKFNMKNYATGEDDEPGLTECGSVGCAVGHGPYCGIQKFSSEDWGEYCFRVFGIDGDTQEFKYLFGSWWVGERLSSRYHVGCRILNFLALDGIPIQLERWSVYQDWPDEYKPPSTLDEEDFIESMSLVYDCTNATYIFKLRYDEETGYTGFTDSSEDDVMWEYTQDDDQSEDEYFQCLIDGIIEDYNLENFVVSRLVDFLQFQVGLKIIKGVDK